MRILILEDQKYPLEILQFAINSVFPEFDENIESDIARSYNQAEEMAKSGGYDFAFIDHRVPLEDVGDLEEKDMQKFSASLREVGYNLIESVRVYNSGVVVIGTSSLSQAELTNFPAPDYSIRKDWDYSEEDLRQVLSQVNQKEENLMNSMIREETVAETRARMVDEGIMGIELGIYEPMVGTAWEREYRREGFEDSQKKVITELLDRAKRQDGVCYLSVFRWNSRSRFNSAVKIDLEKEEHHHWEPSLDQIFPGWAESFQEIATVVYGKLKAMYKDYTPTIYVTVHLEEGVTANDFSDRLSALNASGEVLGSATPISQKVNPEDDDFDAEFEFAGRVVLRLLSEKVIGQVEQISGVVRVEKES